MREHAHHVAQMTAQSCAAMGFKALGELSGLMHDSGKAYHTWQEYLLDKNPPEVVPHAGPGVWLARRLFGPIKAVGAELTLQMLCLAIRGHHGGLHDVLTPDGEPDEPLPLSYSQEENEEAEEKFFSEVASRERLEALFLESCGEVLSMFQRAHQMISAEKGENQEGSRNELMLYLGLAERFLYAALIDADRADAARWGNGECDTVDETPDWEAHLKNLNEELRKLDQSGIGALRGSISATCQSFLSASAGIYRLYVPTGGGKTLSSLAFGVNTAKRWKKDRIFMIAPYLTILEQNANVIRKALGEREGSEPSAVLEHASNVVFDDSEDGEAREQIYNRQTERWRSPEIIMTSTVQILNALFSENLSAVRRMCALCNSVIIFDEVQAIPSECVYLFNMAVNFLANICDCVIVLSTATPPALSELAYPVRMTKPQDIVPNATELFRSFERTELVFENKKHSMKTEELAAYILGKYQENGNCLAVMNTKSVALRLYRAIKESVSDKVELCYLSTELCPANRTDIMSKIRLLLRENKPVICISTQLIEAGVDISFCCVVRAFAGMDSIIQAAGRCNRHSNDTIKNVYVVSCADERLDMLHDIAAGIEATHTLLADFEREPEKLGGNLLSPESILRYYEYYFSRREKALRYAVGKDNNAVSLLGFNEKTRMAFCNEYHKQYPPSLLAQAFHTVGKSFTPIAQNTTGVIVPYKGCNEELLTLFASESVKEQRRCLRRLQKFTVNVYENKLRELKDSGAIRFDEANGIWILNDDKYKEETGICISQTEEIDKYVI